MKVSIITAVYNNISMLPGVLESVSSQSYQNIEHIIIDGDSRDGSKKLLEEYKNHKITYISEPDDGIYDALNKGLNLASGDIICFLHADDLYSSTTVIEEVVKIFETTKCDSVYSDLEYVNQNDTSKIIRYWKSGNFSKNKLYWGWMPPHPALFLTRNIYDRIGHFDKSFCISADYDFILRVLNSKKINIEYLPKVLYKMRVGGESNRSLKNIIKKTKEDYIAIKRNGLFGFFTLFMKNISKLPQFIVKYNA